MGFQKSSEQPGILVGPSPAGVVIAGLGANAGLVGVGAVMVVGSLLFLFQVKEPPVQGQRVSCGDRDPN
jgi:hypothetical protein